MKRLAVGALLVAALLPALAPPVAAQTTVRVLLVGDSWAARFWQTQALRASFAAHGHPEIVEEGDVTAISGSTAAEWTDPAFLQLITDELAAHPTVDIVQLTLGGNDFLAGQASGGWYVGIPDQQALFDQITGDVATVVDHVLALDPEVKVVVSAYDYPNFVESLSGLLAFFCGPLWNGMGQPDTATLNTAIVELAGQLEQLAASRPRVEAFSHWGLMQYTFGFPSAVPPIPPETLLPPGDPTLPSPIETMALSSDCIHLDGDGYDAVAESLWHSYYQRAFDGIFFDGFESGDTMSWSLTVQ